MKVFNINSLRPGDRVYRVLAEFQFYKHYGCYAGRDYRGHWFFEHGKGGNARLVSFEEFAKGFPVRSESIPESERSGAIQRMRELLQDPKEYDAINFNCEHAANYVAIGKLESTQVLLTLAGIGLGALYLCAREA